MHAPRHDTGHPSVLGIVVATVLLAVACASSSAPPAANSRPGAELAPGNASDASARTAAAPAQPTRLRVAYSSLWGANAVPWTAYEAGIFAQHGLDVELTFISSAQTVAAAIANEVAVSFGGGYAAIASRLGGSDLLIFFNVTNWSPYELMVTPDINSGADLRGKTLGVSRFGSASDTATRVALRKLGLVPERDVILIQTSGLTERIAAMRAGALAGGVAVPPDNLVLRREGFKTLLDLGASGEPELTNTAFATAAKTHREPTERALAKYLELDDPEQIGVAYDHFVAQHLDRLPDLGQEAARQYLASLVETDPRAAGAQAADFFDTRFIERVRASGLVERLYANSR